MKIVIAMVVVMGTVEAQNNLTAATQRYFNSIRRNLEASADAMPAEKFGFRRFLSEFFSFRWQASREPDRSNLHLQSFLDAGRAAGVGTSLYKRRRSARSG